MYFAPRSCLVCVGDAKWIKFLCALAHCCVVGKAAPGASISVNVIQHFEHAEGEISVALTFFCCFVYLVILTSCMHILRSLCAVSLFHACDIPDIIAIIYTCICLPNCGIIHIDQRRKMKCICYKLYSLPCENQLIWAKIGQTHFLHY